jgi:hypothetical protein
MHRYFRVVIIDDDEDVFRRLDERLHIEPRSFEGDTFSIDIRPVHVALEQSPTGEYAISSRTIERLVSACAQSPHLLLADFGYADRSVMGQFCKRSDAGEELSQQDLAGKLLTISDLVEAARLYANDPSVDSYKRRTIQRNFLSYDRTLCLYSYAGKAAVAALGEIEARATRTHAAFPNSTVERFDTRYLFYNGREFDWPNPNSKHNPRFYAHLLTGLLDNIIRQKLLEYVLDDARRLKYVRVQRITWSVGFVVALAGSLGAAAEWIGGRVVALASAGLWSVAVVLGTFAALWLLLIGFALPLVFERVMSGLLPKPAQGDSD